LHYFRFNPLRFGEFGPRLARGSAQRRQQWVFGFHAANRDMHCGSGVSPDEDRFKAFVFVAGAELVLLELRVNKGSLGGAAGFYGFDQARILGRIRPWDNVWFFERFREKANHVSSLIPWYTNFAPIGSVFRVPELFSEF
jgi:hypothetical protein